MLVVLFMILPAVVSAKEPYHEHFQFSGGDTFLCDTDGNFDTTEYELKTTIWGNVHFWVFFDNEGNPRQMRWNGTFEGTLTNPDGVVAIDRQHWSEYLDPQTGVGVTAHTFHVRVDGTETVYHDVGRAIVDTNTWEIQWVRGQHPLIDSPELRDLCSALGDGVTIWIVRDEFNLIPRGNTP